MPGTRARVRGHDLLSPPALPALVLAAGLGTRLDPLTRLVAKPAVPLAGRSLIERVLDWLGREATREVVINLHHRPDTITGLVGDGAHLGLRVRYSWEREVLGSAGGPRHALALLDQPAFVIVNGDTLCDVDLGALASAHARSGAEATLAVVPNPASDRYNGVLLDTNDCVRGFVPRGHTFPTWHFVGVQVVTASLFAALPDDTPAETVAGLYRERMATSPGSIRAWRTDAAFMDIGTPRDYWQASLEMAAADPAGWRAAHRDDPIDPSATLVRSVVWPGARVGRDVRLTECVVAGGVRLPAGFEARQAVIVPASIARTDDPARRAGDLALFDL